MENDRHYPQRSNAFGNLLEKGLPAYTALELSAANLESLYAQAFRFYNCGKYAEAASIFELLIYLDYMQTRFIMGLGACHHMMKDFAAALKSYELAASLNPGNPLPLFYASDCCIALNNPAQAINLLRKAVCAAEGQEDYQALKDKALLTIEGLKIRY